MKKLLLAAFLMIALALTMVACNNDPVEPTETTGTSNTTDDATQAPTDAPTEPVEDTAAPTEPVTEPVTEPATEPATEPVTEPETKPETNPETKPETEPVTEPAPEPNQPTNIFYADSLTGTENLNAHESGNPPVLSEDGSYITITPLTGDYHYSPLGSYIDGDRYVAIKYRTTNAEGMSMQIYIGSGTLDNDNDMLKQPIVTDGEWHLAIFDAMQVDGQIVDLTGVVGDPGSYDGSTVAFFRFDPLECEYILDENGNAYKDESGIWVRYPKPEGAYIDVAYIAFFDSAEKAMAFEYPSEDTTFDFASDVSQFENGTALEATDLINVFTIGDPTGCAPTVSGGLYALPASFVQMVAMTDGAYAYTVDIQSASNPVMSGMFVRGFSSANHESSYYGMLADGDLNNFGGTGIYLNVIRNVVDDGLVLRIDIRSVDVATGVLSTHVFEQYIDSTVITVADDGNTVSIMAGGKLIATVEISGEQVSYTTTYMGGSTGEVPAGSLATTAVLTLADGTVTTIENAAVAATFASEVGIANRLAALTFASVSIKPYSSVTIPDEFTRIDPPEVEENAPSNIISPDQLAGNMANGISSIELLEENGEAYVHIIPDAAASPFDPWLLCFIGQDNDPYVVITYRTNTTSGGQFFVGHGVGPAGGDTVNVSWSNSEKWEMMVLNFNDYEHIVKKDGKINYLRCDFIITNNAGDYFDIKSVAMFDSAEKAAAYATPKFEYDAPKWDADKALVTHQSFDELRDGGSGIFAPGNSGGWDKIANITGNVTTLQYWGWIGVKGEVGAFGYQIDQNEAVFDASFTVAAEAPVIAAAAGTGADNASRMLINIDLAGLTGKHVVRVFYKNPDGQFTLLNDFIVNIAEAPAAANLTVEKTTFTVGEAILVTATGSGDQWVGFYLKDDNYGEGATPSLYWYYVDKEGYTSGEAVNIKDTIANSNRGEYLSIPAGEYKLILFADGGYTAAEEIEITVVAG